MADFKTQAQFAEQVGKSPSQISQLKKGITNKGKNAVIGNSLARDMERSLNLPDGWLDVLDYPARKKSSRRFVPVVGSAQMGSEGYWQDEKGIKLGEYGYLEVYRVKTKAYAIRALGESMFPAIRSGWYVVFDPDKNLCSGEFVHVKLKDGRNFIKEFVSLQNGLVNLISVNGGERVSFETEEIDTLTACVEIQPPSRLLSQEDIDNIRKQEQETE